jgi:hypothetical protein
MFRALRWLGLAAVAPVLWACQARSLEAPDLKPESTFVKTFQQSINRNVDMLFLIDDSSSMRLSQDNLNRNFPTFMTTLQMAEQGLPNLHVAVVSSDMGAGDGTVSGCNSSGGKNGIFQYSPRNGCTATNLQQGATYIVDSGGQRNYTGNIEDVFTCIAALGQDGCGFEHQFAAILRALGADGQAPPAENQGFLRPEAYLAIIMITNEDDCSASPGDGPNGRIPLFDTGSNTNLMSQLGPPSNFRCNEFGHMCDGMHPSRNAPNNDVAATVNYTSCTSNDTEGYLLGVVDTANRIKKLKPDPSQVIVAAITGPATPYTVKWKPPTADTSCGAASCPWPLIGHSCGSEQDPAGFADPGVRVNEFVKEFGANGLALEICSDDFAPSLRRIGDLINQQLQPPCIGGTVANKPGTSEPDCTVVSHTLNDLGRYLDSTVPACSANGGAAPCWRLTTGMCTGNQNGQIVQVSADPNLPAATAQNATVNCALCTPGVSDPARGCP